MYGYDSYGILKDNGKIESTRRGGYWIIALRMNKEKITNDFINEEINESLVHNDNCEEKEIYENEDDFIKRSPGDCKFLIKNNTFYYYHKNNFVNLLNINEW